MSRWNDADVRRGSRSKGVARALRQTKRAEADERNAKAKRNRRRQARLKDEA